jgi:hypothetical protein
MRRDFAADRWHVSRHWTQSGGPVSHPEPPDRREGVSKDLAPAIFRRRDWSGGAGTGEEILVARAGKSLRDTLYLGDQQYFP